MVFGAYFRFDASPAPPRVTPGRHSRPDVHPSPLTVPFGGGDLVHAPPCGLLVRGCGARASQALESFATPTRCHGLGASVGGWGLQPPTHVSPWLWVRGLCGSPYGLSEARVPGACPPLACAARLGRRRCRAGAAAWPISVVHVDFWGKWGGRLRADHRRAGISLGGLLCAGQPLPSRRVHPSWRARDSERASPQFADFSPHPRPRLFPALSLHPSLRLFPAPPRRFADVF